MYFICVYLLTFLSFTVSNFTDTTVNRFNEWLKNHQFKILNDNHLLHVFKNWISNDDFIINSNILNLPYKLGHNFYSGYSFAEFRAIMNFENNKNILISKDYNTTLYLNQYNIPSSIDWREKGVVNDIKDQGQCGSCWAFSTIQSLESASAIKYGKLYSLSEQQLVDCDNLKNNGKDHGCNGGLMDNAFNWINKNDGVCSEEEYPYTSGVTKSSQSCSKCKNEINTDIIDFKDITQNSDDAMMSALSLQPVSVAIEADQREFQLYKLGIYSSPCGTNLDHGVGLVGYGKDYYILRNSWGSSWGDNGYMMIGKGNDPLTGKPYNDGNGQCGVLMQGSYPVV